MKSLKPSWEKAAVWICTKCGNEMEKPCFGLGVESNPGEELKNQLKSRLRDQGMSKDIRVMTSSCLGTCPKGEQAMLFLSDTASVQVFSPTSSVDHILNSIHEHFLPRR